MVNHRKPGVISLLQQQLHSLNGVMKEVGEAILKQPDKVARMNVTGLAEISGTSEAAVVRLAQRLGYSGFRDLQINLAYDLGDQRSDPRSELNEEIELDDSMEVIAEKAYHANIDGLSQTRNLLDKEALKSAAQLINRARAVHIFAQGINYSTGVDLSYNLMKIGFLCQVYNDSYMQSVASAITDKRDVVIGISHTGANLDVLESLSITRQNGAGTIGITAKESSPITRISEISLCISPKEMLVLGEPFTSRMSMLYLIDILFLGVASLSNATALQNLQKVKDALKTKRYPS